VRRSRPAEHVLRGQDPELSYGQTGEPGDPLVLLHGLGARWQVFQPLMIRLDEQFQQYAPDLRGHGTSARTPGHYNIGDFTADAIRFIEATGRAPVSLYGHSLGGWIALTTAAQRPDLVSALIIADSAVYPEHLDPDLVVSYLADLPIALRSLAKSFDQLDPEVMTHFRDGRMLSGYEPDVLLTEVSCPTLLIQGDAARGALMSDADVKSATRLLTDADHVFLPGLGHALHAEDAGIVAAEIRSFLEYARGENTPSAGG
jgi:pimeloyl-ACP methyl ester carboxylesterase